MPGDRFSLFVLVTRKGSGPFLLGFYGYLIGCETAWSCCSDNVVIPFLRLSEIVNIRTYKSALCCDWTIWLCTISILRFIGVLFMIWDTTRKVLRQLHQRIAVVEEEKDDIMESVDRTRCLKASICLQVTSNYNQCFTMFYSFFAPPMRRAERCRTSDSSHF